MHTHYDPFKHAGPMISLKEELWGSDDDHEYNRPIQFCKTFWKVVSYFLGQNVPTRYSCFHHVDVVLF